jgi:hypothetical protein
LINEWFSALGQSPTIEFRRLQNHPPFTHDNDNEEENPGDNFAIVPQRNPRFFNQIDSFLTIKFQ